MNNNIKIDYYKKVVAIRTHKDYVFPEKIKKEIDEYWKETIKKRPSFRRGKIYCVSTMQEEEEQLTIYLDNTDYAHYLYGHQNRDYICHNFCSGCLIETIDHYYILGLTSNISEIYHQYSLAGTGAVDSHDFIGDELDPLVTAKRELKEEIGIDLDDSKIVDHYYGVYLMTNDKRESVGAIYKVNLKITKEEMTDFFKKYNQYLEQEKEEIEFTDLVFIPKDEEKVKKIFLNSKIQYIDYIPNLILHDIEVSKS